MLRQKGAVVVSYQRAPECARCPLVFSASLEEAFIETLNAEGNIEQRPSGSKHDRRVPKAKEWFLFPRGIRILSPRLTALHFKAVPCPLQMLVGKKRRKEKERKERDKKSSRRKRAKENERERVGEWEGGREG